MTREQYPTVIISPKNKAKLQQLSKDSGIPMSKYLNRLLNVEDSLTTETNRIVNSIKEIIEKEGMALGSENLDYTNGTYTISFNDPREEKKLNKQPSKKLFKKLHELFANIFIDLVGSNDEDTVAEEEEEVDISPFSTRFFAPDDESEESE